jgi:hypothetical protein
MPDQGAKEKDMRMQCQPGDIALVIHDEAGCVPNIGHLVMVRGPIWREPESGLPCWLIKPLHRQPWRVLEPDGSITTEFVCWKGRVRHPDSWLLPLRPEASEAAAQEFFKWLDELRRRTETTN